jgi:hypothetical protein
MSINLGNALSPCFFAIFALTTLSESSGGAFFLLVAFGEAAKARCALWLEMSSLTIAVQTRRWSSGWEGPAGGGRKRKG